MSSASTAKHLIFWGVMAGTALLIWAVVKSSSDEGERRLTFTQFTEELERNNVREVRIGGTDVSGVLAVHGALKKDGQKFEATVPAYYPDMYKALQEKKVPIVLETGTTWVTWLANGLPMILLLGLWVFFMAQMKRGRYWKWPPPNPPQAS